MKFDGPISGVLAEKCAFQHSLEVGNSSQSLPSPKWWVFMVVYYGEKDTKSPKKKQNPSGEYLLDWQEMTFEATLPGKQLQITVTES